ncbi:MAG TPA: hypothetical protein VH186_24520 [Chloroflexia bacterium]|nr:hypothetical protein [Chloroflexia bacterium]
MILDFSDLAKLYRTASFTNTNYAATSTASDNLERSQPEWWAADKPQPAPFSGYSRDYLLDYLLHYCRLCQQAKRQGSLPVLQALVELEPDNGEIHFLLGYQYELMDERYEALLCYERAAALRPDLPNYMLAAVRMACLLGDYNKGLGMVGSVISAYPTMAEAYYERGLIYEVDENWGRALRDYEMCSRLEPQNPIYMCSMASMYRQQKLYKMARRCAVKALKLDPHCSQAHEELRQLPLFDQVVDFLRPGDRDTAVYQDEQLTATYN